MFEETKDHEWIFSIFSLQYIIDESFPDNVKEITHEQIKSAVKNESLRFIKISKDKTPIGFFLLEVKYPEIEIHTVIEKQYRGAFAFRCAKEFAEWAFNKYPMCHQLITHVPEFNKAAALFARSGGMKQIDRDSDPFIKNGKEHAMQVFMIKRGD